VAAAQATVSVEARIARIKFTLNFMPDP